MLEQFEIRQQIHISLLITEPSLLALFQNQIWKKDWNSKCWTLVMVLVSEDVRSKDIVKFQTAPLSKLTTLYLEYEIGGYRIYIWAGGGGYVKYT